MSDDHLEIFAWFHLPLYNLFKNLTKKKKDKKLSLFPPTIYKFLSAL